MLKRIYKEIELSSVLPFPNNPQKVSDAKMGLMIHDMKENGWVGQAPLAWLNKEENKLYWISGHHRASAALSAGIKTREIEIIIDDSYDWKRATADLLKYNNVHGEPDEDIERELILEIMEETDDMQSVSFMIGREEQEIDEILNKIKIEDEIKEKEIDEFDLEHKWVIIMKLCKCGCKQEIIFTPHHKYHPCFYLPKHFKLARLGKYKNTINKNTMYTRAKTVKAPILCIYEKLNQCKGGFEVHHIDNDITNNSENNLLQVCISHHRLIHTNKFDINNPKKLKFYIEKSGKRRYKHE